MSPLVKLLREAADHIEQMEARGAGRKEPPSRHEAMLEEQAEALNYMIRVGRVIAMREGFCDSGSDFWRVGRSPRAVALRAEIARSAMDVGFSMACIGRALGYHHTTVLAWLRRRAA